MTLIIRKVSPANLNRLRIAFGDVLLDNGIRYHKIGMFEDGSELVFIFESSQKVHEIRWNKATIIGNIVNDIAQDVLGPVLADLKQRLTSIPEC